MPNHLFSEKSPYLLQHAHNPVDWYPWSKAAFDKARQQHKPVLLSIGYSTCHWCHVMAHESFEDQGIAQLINDHFIAIKVDREERPDLDQIYMSATTAMTGQGGWPLTVFLTWAADPFYGGTYFPPYAKWGSVGFIDLLNSIASEWKKDPEKIMTSGRSITEMLKTSSTPGVEEIAPIKGHVIIERAFGHMQGQFDEANGGFGTAPKFPMGHGLSFLMRYYRSHKEPQALRMVEKTLTAMARGGIWDHLGGGFHRYSTDPNWHVPHFEKMLYDQALLARSYLEAYQLTSSVEYGQMARAVLDYVLRDMTDPQGGFYSAQDADSLDGAGGHIKEGVFYVFAQDEIEEVLGQETAAVFNDCYGVRGQGNVSFDPHGEFTGKNILYLANPGQETLLAQARADLLAWRNRRPRPHKDDKVLCDWNGLMISSFAFAGRVLQESEYIQTASRAADFILARMMVKGRLWHRWREGEAGIMATLEDYAFLIYGLLDLYEADFQDKYLLAAQNLADKMIELFADPQGGFYMTASDAQSLILRPKDAYDGAIPSGNSVAALVLLKLYALSGKEIYDQQAEKLFAFFAPLLDQAPYAYSFLLAALDWHLQGPMEIGFQGSQDDPVIAQMIKILYKSFIPVKVVKFEMTQNKAAANICYRGRCQAPIHSAGELEKELEIGR